jgi:hypothetical protein
LLKNQTRRQSAAKKENFLLLFYKKEGFLFFFEKKNQKTFLLAALPEISVLVWVFRGLFRTKADTQDHRGHRGGPRRLRRILLRVLCGPLCPL